MGKQGQRRGRLVLVPCPLQGHISPMLQLGTILHSRGFSITIVHTQFNSPNPLNYPAFNFVSVPENIADHERFSQRAAAFLLLLNARCGTPFEECLSEMIKQEPSDKIACIIYDEFMYFCDAIADRLKLPSIMLRTSNAATFLSRSAIWKMKLEGHIPIPVSKLQDLVPQHHPLRFKDLSISHLPVEDVLQVIMNLSNVKSASALILNTMDCLEQLSLAKIQQQRQHPIFKIGPIHKFAPAISSSLLEEDTGCMAWLDKQACRSVIYVSLGSLVSITTEELAEMAWGLVNSKQPFLWVIRPGSVSGSQLMESLPQGFHNSVEGRGRIVKWAPQKEVLAHNAVGGFWSHCGWNSTLESICEGIPMICRPCFGDQQVTARYVSHVWRVGLQYENALERGEVETTIRRLMVEKEGEEIRQNTKDLKEKVEISIQEGGSSYNSLNELVEFLMAV